jgi:putative flippase GtrA
MAWHLLPAWVRRMVSFSGIALCTFLGDIALLWILLHATEMHYTIATAISFFFALTANYFLTRKYTFKNTARALHEGYVIFMATALVGVVFVIGVMALLVELLHVAPIIARILSASIGAVWNYVINLKYNFKVEGKHQKARGGAKAQARARTHYKGHCARCVFQNAIICYVCGYSISILLFSGFFLYLFYILILICTKCV